MKALSEDSSSVFFLVRLERIEKSITQTEKRNQNECLQHPSGAHTCPELVQIERNNEQDVCCKQRSRSNEN
jgi:hypothetical protein